jgi:ATP synthase protein I
LIGSLIGSALIGWLIDRWFGTGPWALIVMLFLGIAVAFRQIIRIANERPE